MGKKKSTSVYIKKAESPMEGKRKNFYFHHGNHLILNDVADVGSDR